MAEAPSSLGPDGPFSDLRLDPGLPTKELLQAFRRAADLLLNRALLRVGAEGAEEEFRIVEVEAYLRGKGHDDVFTHGTQEQAQLGLWYFHQTGGEYRGGTYKGLDVTIGDGQGSCGGFLVRSIESVPTGEVVEGPCNAVDRILAINGRKEDVRGLVNDMGRLGVAEADRLRLVPRPPDEGGKSQKQAHHRPIYQAPRVGLTLRQEAGRPFHMADYRYSTTPHLIHKFKIGFCLRLHRIGRTHDEIIAATKVQPRVLDRYLEFYTRGRKELKHSDCLDQEIATVALLGENYGAWCAEFCADKGAPTLSPQRQKGTLMGFFKKRPASESPPPAKRLKPSFDQAAP